MCEYKKYDVNFKINAVEEYIRLAENNKITKAEYAHENGLADSTFNDWVLKYQRNKERYFNINENQLTLKNNEPTFIEISDKRRIREIVDVVDKNADVKLKYKDITLEFKEDQLEKVLEIVRRW